MIRALAVVALLGSCAAGAQVAVRSLGDLSTVDRRSPEFKAFRDFVDAAQRGRPGYAFAAIDAATLHALTGERRYCELAVDTVERQVADAEAAIAKGKRPEIAGDSYLHVGDRIADVATTYEACTDLLDATQRERWRAYAERALTNVWSPREARWGDTPFPWTGWGIDNPDNNYHYSFIEATMRWALASGSGHWTRELRDARLPALMRAAADVPGGGSREGTGYGAAQRRLFALYRLWQDGTGQALPGASRHAADAIAYWVHATVPTRDRFAPIGDQSRVSEPVLYDYHRDLVSRARAATDEADARALASWWLGHITQSRMHDGFNRRHGLLPAGDEAREPTATWYHAAGVGHLFARSGWDEDATWLAFVAGPYRESHAHQDQGSFTLFGSDWLAVTANIHSHSGIRQEPAVHNALRFERADPSKPQCGGPANDAVVHQCLNTASTMRVEPIDGGVHVVADLSPAYRGRGAPAVTAWQRTLRFAGDVLEIDDDYATADGVSAVFQLNVPQRPEIAGATAMAGDLRMTVLEPADATLDAIEWRRVDDDIKNGFRIDVRGGRGAYRVRLERKSR